MNIDLSIRSHFGLSFFGNRRNLDLIENEKTVFTKYRKYAYEGLDKELKSSKYKNTKFNFVSFENSGSKINTNQRIHLDFAYSESKGLARRIWSGLSAMTLGIIPFYNKNEIALEAKVYGREGKIRKIYRYIRNYHYFRFTPLILVSGIFQQRKQDHILRNELIEDFLKEVSCDE
jgi:hypothetical protein